MKKGSVVSAPPFFSSTKTFAQGSNYLFYC